MCKKLVIAAVAILVGTAVVKHTTIGSLCQVWWHDAKQVIERQVPPEVQIKQLAVEVGKIDADIKRNLSKLAQQEVEKQKLSDDLVALKEDQSTLKADITAMTKSLENNTENVSLSGRNWAANRLARQLESSVVKYERNKHEIASKEKVLAKKTEALEAAHARIQEMTSQKEQLRDTVANLQARLELARLNATRNNASVEFDDSQVARCKELAGKISERIAQDETEMTLLNRYGYGTSQPKAEEAKPAADVLKAAKKALQDEDARVDAGNTEK
jgi:predicted  nucleic acid-binding Zn-ribbon protein